jgi:hypothetical protein
MLSIVSRFEYSSLFAIFWAESLVIDVFENAQLLLLLSIFFTGFSMSRGYNYIKHLKKNLDVYKIGFRVLDSWNVSASNGNQHMEFIIGDAKVAEIYLFFVANLLINNFFSSMLYIWIYIRIFVLFVGLG